MSPPEPSKRPSGSLLPRRADQAVVATAVAAALVALAGYWFAHGGHRGQLIEIERATRQSARFQIDLNEADWPELAQLPGVGETIARRIVETRAAEGPFGDVDDLRRVRGIGSKTLERIRPYLVAPPGQGTVAAQRQ